MLTIEHTVKLNFEIHECGACFIKFGVPGGYTDKRRDDHASFYCPNGHSLHYPQDNVEEALRKKLHAATLDKERAEKLARDSQEAKRIAETMEQRHKTELSRLKTRAAAGVCPCCNRTFKQLAAHMKNKHPDANEVVRKRLKAAKPFFTEAQLKAAAKLPTPAHLFQGADVKSPKVN